MSDKEMQSGSVSGWISKMRSGDPDAIRSLVERYFSKIAQYSDHRIKNGIRVTDDGEDIAVTVLEIITRKVASGELPDLQDRDDLWLMMILIAQRSVIDRQRSELRRKKLASSMVTMTDLLESYNIELSEFLAQDDPKQKLVEILECWDDLVRSLPDDRSRQIAHLKMQGKTNKEIGEILEMVSRTVDRKVNSISNQWQAYLDELN
jgi:DNA-directed RNA polymerase specialized sigma24 family protein